MKSSRCRLSSSAGGTLPSKLQHEIILTYIHTQILTYYLVNISFIHLQIILFTYSPHRFEKCEDMVNLTYLNDASVFWNLKTRYQAKMIHTYSGIFSYSGILAYLLFHPNRPVCDCDQPLQAVPALHPQVQISNVKLGFMSIIATRSMAPRLKGKITALLTICSIGSTSLNYDKNIYNFIAQPSNFSTDVKPMLINLIIGIVWSQSRAIL